MWIHVQLILSMSISDLDAVCSFCLHFINGIVELGPSMTSSSTLSMSIADLGSSATSLITEYC